MPSPKYDKKLVVEFRDRPKYKWKLIEGLGKMHGGLNAGIFKVMAKDKAPEMVFIQKRFGPTEFQHGVAHREIQILHQISDHPNITTLIDHFLDPPRLTGAVYLEYCDQGSLDNVIEQVMYGKRVNEHKIWNWFIQLAEGLVYCHCGPHPEMSATELLQFGWSKVYHRDIKPGNILLTAEGNQIVAKLADFGCAVSEDFIALNPEPDKAITASMWTKGYDAPEHPFFSGASDIWQMALSIMCVCTGIVSPKSNNNLGGQPWHLARSAAKEYSEELSWALKGCLVVECTERPTAVSVLKHLNQQYKAVVARLSPDNFPMDIFEPRAGRGPRAPAHGQMGPALGYTDFGQHAGDHGLFPGVNPMGMLFPPNFGGFGPRVGPRRGRF